ncbi:hemocyanin F chain-like [Glandiceps talaboti]
MEWVEDIVALCGKNLANSTRKGFSKTGNKVQVEKEDRGLVLDDVLQSTKSTLDKLHVDGNREDNIRYRHMTFLRAEILLEKEQFQEAEQLVNQMIEDLRSRGVKEYITREIKWEWLLRKGDVNSLPPGIDSQRREIWRTVPPKVTELQELVKQIVNWQDDESAIDDDEDDDDDEESGIGRSTVFSAFNDEHLVLSSNIIQQIFAKADDCGDIVETLEFVDSLQKTRRYNNTLIQYALKIFLTHHAIARSNRLKVPEFIDEPSMMDTSAHAMVPPIGPPQEIWMDYWRNDAHFVDHHRHWHMVYRAHGLPGTDKLHLDRQGELFGYMHAQLLARYNTERESWGLGPVEPWHFMDVDQLGCDVGEEFHSSQQNRRFRPRPSGTKFPRSRVVKFQEWTDNIRQAFKEGILQPNPGTGLTAFNIDSNNDMETPSYSAANWVGHIVEATSSTFYDTYGSIHNSGHGVFGSSGQRRGMSSYMSTTDHAVRDHIFFRWHTFIDNLIDEFHQTRITELAVDAPPVVITGNDVMISTSDSAPKGFTDWSENGWRNNYTHAGTIQTILDVAQYQFEWGKLSHEPFYFHIRVKRQRWTGSELRLTVRIFICPARHENDRRRWIEMDKFRYVMAATETHSTITRKDKHSSVIKRDPTDPDYSDDLEIPLARTVSGFCECGWPYNLLLPKGTKDGEPYRLAVLISDNNVDALKIRSQCGSLSYCGSRDNRYPDRRQMGYPFATPMAVNGKEVSITEALEQLPNFAASSFVIENRDVRFGEVHPTSDTKQALEMYLTSWSAHSQAKRRHNDYKTSKWNGRLRVLIDGRFTDETNAFADTGYTKIKLQGRGLGNGKYSISDVTLAERQGRTLNTIGKIYQITFNNGETSTIVPETGLESDAIEMVFAPDTEYFITYTLETPGVYLVTNGDVTYTWRMAEPDERGREEMNWDLDDIQRQITQTRSNIYVIDKILVNEI